jgi:hypothetical protein
MKLKNVKIGFYLATRQIRRASKWTTALIISVMVLTFLNLTVVSGILVGLIQGSIDENKEISEHHVVSDGGIVAPKNQNACTNQS